MACQILKELETRWGMLESDECFPADFLVVHKHLSTPNAVSIMKKRCGEIHDLEVTEEKPDETSDETKESELSESKEDNVFNYGCLHLSLGLFLHNADDSAK